MVLLHPNDVTQRKREREEKTNRGPQGSKVKAITVIIMKFNGIREKGPSRREK